MRRSRIAIALLALALVALLVAGCSVIASTMLENKVKAAIKAEPKLAGLTLDVAVEEGGVVKVGGEVADISLRKVIEDTVKKVAGVKGVIVTVHVRETESGTINTDTVEGITGSPFS
jgi:hypothetical protein